jgi:hypothetical protein
MSTCEDSRSYREHLRQLFGCDNYFSHSVVDGPWHVYKVSQWSQPNVYHGLCLSQLYEILRTGTWKAGLWNGSSKTSPLAVWVATRPSIAMDRASLKRGYAATGLHGDVPTLVPNGWDCPVAIGLNLVDCGLHKSLKNGVELRRYLTQGRSELPLDELHIVECRIFTSLYQRYNTLNEVWEEVARGRRLLCRCRTGHPGDFFEGGHNAPLSCGRTTTTPDEDRWIMTCRTGTRQWRCPDCESNMRKSVGSVTGIA